MATLAFAGSNAFAAGYEKTVLWSGKYGGIAGITAGNAQGADALAFNPAGILTAKTGQELSSNLSVVQSQFKGPIGSDNVQNTGDTTYVAPFSFIYSATVNEKLAFAIGGYTAGGAKAEYNAVTFPMSGTTNNALSGVVKTDLAIQEIAAGVAYKPMDKLKIGASWRVAMARANFASVVPNSGNTQVQNVEFSNLKDTQWTGYRLGAQWEEETWGVGLAYRSEMLFNASGDAAGKVGIGSGTTATLTSPGGATLSTALPMQISVGGWYDVSPKIWRAFAEYNFTNYSRVDVIGISGSGTVAGTTTAFPNLRMNWLDQHNVRLAGEYLGTVVPVRFGYAWTSQVTSTDYARATFTPPGQAHTFTAGTGMDFMEGTLRTNAGLDYTMSSGAGSSPKPSEGVRSGDYSVSALSLHLGVAYMF